MTENEKISIYESIAERTQGDIYFGVVGPVRSGKSTFIKRFMDLLVVPNLKNDYEKQRLIDEMPQSGTGKTVMTAEPKFIPADAAELTLDDNVKLNVRMIDCVGYMIPGALGAFEDGNVRMVSTPWTEEKIPFTEAAEIGTSKVIRDHSTVGIVVTSDGSIGDLERDAYENAEERVIKELKEIKKPFVVLLNSKNPGSEATVSIANSLSDIHGVPVIPVDCMNMTRGELDAVMGETLYQFPVSQVNFFLPGFTEGLPEEHWIKKTIIESMSKWADSFDNLADIKKTVTELADGRVIEGLEIENIDLATGNVDVNLNMANGLFYQVVSEITERDVKNDAQFFTLIREFALAKRKYDKLEGAMNEVGLTGYGIVKPRLSEMILEEPEVFRQGNKYGVRLKAKAPSMHIIRTDITTEVSPIVGTEKQSEELAQSLKNEFAENPDAIWKTNFFGKTLYEMVEEQMENKLTGVPEGVRVKVQRSLQRISDEGKEYFICIII